MVTERPQLLALPTVDMMFEIVHPEGGADLLQIRIASLSDSLCHTSWFQMHE